MLEIVCALAVTALVVTSVIVGLNLNLIVAVIMVIAVYAVLRDVRVLTYLKRQSREAEVQRESSPRRNGTTRQVLDNQQNGRSISQVNR